MNAPSASLRRPAWLRTKLSAALLVTLLQRTPAVRLVHAATALIAGSPIAVVLKSALATFATLAAVDSLAGATTLLSSSGSPLSAKVGVPITPVAFTVSDTINIASWNIGGALPPGVVLAAREANVMLTGPGKLDATSGAMAADPNDPYGGGGGMAIVTTTPFLTGTPTQPGTYTITLQAAQPNATAGALVSAVFSYSIVVAADAAPPPNAAPAFATQPQVPAGQGVVAGGTITLNASASGTPAPTYQWRKDGTPIAGATGASLTLTNLQVADSGTYTVVATNSAGNVTSSAAVLTVFPPASPSMPAIARQPQAQTIASGSTIVFSAEASGAGLSYQWRRNGTPIAGATRAAYVLGAATAADAGAYSVEVSNTVGAVMSTTAALNVVEERNFGHLVNLSIRTSISAADPFFTVGTVVGGAGTSGAKPLLVRAVGPSLAAFGLAGAIADSRLDVLAGTTLVATNNDWNGEATLSAAFAQVGAFPLASNTSKDAAVYNAGFAARDYTIQIGGVGGATGEVLAELYDATATDTFGASTPRLVNVSVRKQIDAGSSLTAGFVVGGNTARTVLVRAIGPGLAAFGVAGTLADPQLALFAGTAKIAENDNWGGDSQLTGAGSGVGAFAIANASSKDAMLLITLAPGNYTAQVSGVTGSGGGSALVEVYEVP